MLPLENQVSLHTVWGPQYAYFCTSKIAAPPSHPMQCAHACVHSLVGGDGPPLYDGPAGETGGHENEYCRDIKQASKHAR